MLDNIWCLSVKLSSIWVHFTFSWLMVCSSAWLLATQLKIHTTRQHMWLLMFNSFYFCYIHWHVVCILGMTANMQFRWSWKSASCSEGSMLNKQIRPFRKIRNSLIWEHLDFVLEHCTDSLQFTNELFDSVLVISMEGMFYISRELHLCSSHRILGLLFRPWLHCFPEKPEQSLRG